MNHKLNPSKLRMVSFFAPRRIPESHSDNGVNLWLFVDGLMAGIYIFSLSEKNPSGVSGVARGALGLIKLI